MLTVYVWNFRGKDVAWGHASMQVRQTYISWWPGGEGRVRSLPSAERVPVIGGTLGQIYAVNPIRNRTFQADFAAEGRKLPDHRLLLNGLDEDAILDWWQQFGLTREGVLYQGPLPAWHTMKMNCSTVVAKGLEIGGGDKYAGWWSSHNLIWKPDDVLRYALAIQQGLARKRR